ncbi:MAG: hypothetical protein IJY42_02735 [Clostridia bacterium]|nr:hypothetical protein [Clostridia bacterium]
MLSCFGTGIRPPLRFGGGTCRASCEQAPVGFRQVLDPMDGGWGCCRQMRCTGSPRPVSFAGQVTKKKNGITFVIPFFFW